MSCDLDYLGFWREIFCHSTSVSLLLLSSFFSVRSSFLLTLPRALDMSTPKEVEVFIGKSFAENNKQLMSQISLLVSQSVENLKCSHTEAAMDQLREIKKIKQEEPKSFNR